jgi:hypothetical protein
VTRLIRLLCAHPSVASYWLMIACIAAALGALLAINGFILMAIAAGVLAAYAILFLIAVDRYGKGSLRTIAMVIRSARPSR